MAIEYRASEQFCSAAKTEYEYELGRNANLDNKVSITLAFCGAVLLFLIDYLNIRSLWNFDAQIMCWECILRFLCTIFQIGSLVCFGVCIIRLFLILRPRTYLRVDTEFLLDETLPEWKPEQAHIYLGRRYSQFAANNNKINEKRSQNYSYSVRWLLIAVLMCFFNEIIKFNFL